MCPLIDIVVVIIDKITNNVYKDILLIIFLLEFYIHVRFNYVMLSIDSKGYIGIIFYNVGK